VIAGTSSRAERRIAATLAILDPSRREHRERRNSYGDFTHRNPMWFVALEISPLPRVPTM
jgi:hypothetical protein